MKGKKLILGIAALALVAVISIAGTMAYLTSQDEVTNTFTVGKIAITLDEVKVTPEGVVDTSATGRVKQNTYKLIPGHTYTKDPIVHVQPDSEHCYVFVKIADGLSEIEDTKTIATQITENGWTALTGVSGVYWKEQAAVTGSNAVDLKVFESFKLKSDANVAAYENATIKITAYAIQYDGFASAAEAWSAAPAAWKN